VNEQQQKNIIKLIGENHGEIQQRINSFLLNHNTATDALSLTLSQLGYFNKAQVLHLMPATCPDWLCYLASVITELCQHSEISLDNRAYKPHLSLYRKAKIPLALPNQLLLNTQLPSDFCPKTSINSFSLYHSYSSSSGVTYLPIHTWKLNY
jgi:2'-5' RNA ligase